MEKTKTTLLPWPQPLERAFRLFIFDWDGTAVEDRKANADRLIKGLESLLKLGASCVIITGTSFENILRQGIEALSLEAKKALYICCNRGSEVYSFSSDGTPNLLYRRVASAKENQALDHAIEETQSFATKRGLHTKIISNRLNRRKLDLIPVPHWSDPKKAEFRELWQDVEERLATFGFKGGIKDLLDAAEAICRSNGIDRPKITSDIKHIEIGLTDKSDSIRWIYENVILIKKIPLSEIVFFGDEFGSIGGLQGSDSLMRLPEVRAAIFASVGAEPEGVPDEVIGLGGGPKRFVEFLEYQIDRWEQAVAEQSEPWTPSQDPAWVIEQEGFDPSREREVESLFSIGNGYLGVRGSSDFPLPTSQADLFIAGVYDHKATALPYSEVEFIADKERDDPFTEIVPFPSPFSLMVKVQGKELRLGSPDLKKHARNLDLAQGIYFENYLFEDEKGRKTLVRTMRFTSMVDRHLLFQEVEVVCENHSSEIEVEFAAPVAEFKQKYPHLKLEENSSSPGIAKNHLYATGASGMTCSIGHRIWSGPSSSPDTKLRFQAKPGERNRARHAISVFTSRDTDSPEKDSAKHLLAQSWNKLEGHLREHVKAWKKSWEDHDIHIEHRPELLQAQRFNIYHLRITADHDRRVSVGARALTGRAYEGHVFWDTEIFMFPFYLYTEPEIAKSLLLYRYHTLDGARRRARLLGCEGACYAWESTVTGEDVTPRVIVIKGSEQEIPIFTGAQQLHVTADVSFAIWAYWNATLDSLFLADHGVEVLVETARFWKSRLKPEAGVFRLRAVVGPDEYHHDVSDNAFTNWMVRFNLEKAAWAVEWLKKYDQDRARHLGQRLNLSDDEIKVWRKIAQNVYRSRTNSDGVVEQFEGFCDLRSIALSSKDRMRAPLSRLFGWQEINELKIIKQADVLMIPFLFPNAFAKPVLLANYQYYEPITDHGSSLSPCVHAAIAARCGLQEQATRYWEQSLDFDLMNLMKNTALGIHSGCIGGTWQALIFHMLGVTLSERGIELDQQQTPVLPTGCGKMELKLYYRGKRHSLRISREGRIAA